MYIAHKSKDGRKQPLIEHLTNVAKLSSQFAKSFNAENIAYEIGLYHDIGKYSDEFQKRINGSNIKVDHSTPGAKEVANFNYGPIIAEAIAGHHTGLPDLGNDTDIPNGSSLKSRFQRPLCNIDAYKNELKNNNSYKEYREYTSNWFDIMFFTRMLFSCLVDADRTDTRLFNNIQINNNVDTIEKLTKTINQIITQIIANPSNKLNKIRSSILSRCLQSANSLDNGIYKLNLPTGAGKTLDSIAFALNNAMLNHKDRIIFIVPYTSIIDQTAMIYKSYFGQMNVLEHHSDIDYEINDDDYDNIKEIKQYKKLATTNWDSPIIITTVVQFFESLFSYKTSKCQKLHNIANSIIIFDEAQTIPIEYLKSCLRAIYELYKHYNCSIVLSTATQPPFEELFSKMNINVQLKDICAISKEEQDTFKHCNIQELPVMTKEDFLNIIDINSQSLIICNTKSLAEDLYLSLHIDNKYYLTTNLTSFDRKQRIKEISNDLKNDKPIIVISTSLIEAGVDFDFQYVYREFSGIDNIIQCAGRCNREGKRPVNDCYTYYFELSDSSVEYHVAKNKNASFQALKRNLNIFDTQYDYYMYLWNYLVETDKKDILNMHNGYNGIFMPFREISNEFKLIEQEGKTIYIDNSNSCELLKKLRNIIKNDLYIDQSLLTKLEQFSIGVSNNTYKELLKLNWLEVLDESISILDSSHYDKEIGLSHNFTTTGLFY